MDPRKEQEWADAMDYTDRFQDEEPTYPDGSVQHECWAESGYTRKPGKRAPENDSD